MWKKILTISLLLVIGLSLTTACAQEIEEEVELPTAQEIVDGAIESFDKIKTYQFDMIMTMDMAGEVEGEALEQTVTMDNSGTLDLENVQMKADLSIDTNMVAPEEGEMGMSVEMYIIDGMMYAKPEAPGEESTWMKEEVPAEAWEMLSGISRLEKYKDLLETAQVEVIGSEKVEGVDCYVLKLTPEMAQLWQTAMGQGGIAELDLPPAPEELLEDVFHSFSVKQWIAKDTYFLMKTEIDMAMESTPELMEHLGEEVEMSINIALSFLAYNYNQPVTIVLPSEAEEVN